jgi:lysophospholipid acyltransferase 7
MFISAYWHGLHPGYYLSFLTIPLCIAAESAMEGSVRARLGPGGQSAFDWVHWFLKMRAYDYMCMGFVLLKAGDTVHYWTSIYFIIHVLAVGCIVFGRLTRGGKRGEKRGEKEEGKVEEMESKDKLKEGIRAKQD